MISYSAVGSSLTPSYKSSALRSKRWAPKVKTGCITCKIRRIKCDEEKPFCRRCVSTGRKCDGYNSHQLRFPSQTVSSVVAPVSIPRSPPADVQLCGTAASRDLVLLAPITTIYIGHASLDYISANISRLILSSDELSSYVSHVPYRLGQGGTLDVAVDCVVAAFHHLYMTPASQSCSAHNTISLYTRALKSLQNALYEPEQSLSADTLCATVLLCIFEYMSMDKGQAWAKHARGAARLIEHRGPERFKTEFEKSLLMTQLGIIVTEAFLDSKHCFFDDEVWRSTLRSAICPTERLSDRSELVVSLYENMIPFTGVMADCFTFITNQAANSEEPLHGELLRQVYANRSNFLLWYDRWANDLSTQNSGDGSLLDDGAIRRLEVLNMHRASILLCNRLLACLDGQHGHVFELQAREMALQIITSLQHVPPTNIRAANMNVTAATAHAILVTAEDFNISGVLPELAPDRGKALITPENFCRWIELMGGRVHREPRRPKAC